MEKLIHILHSTPYNRILVLGCPAVGKTTWANQLTHITGLPLYHMDELYWLPKWQRPSEELFLSQLQSLLITDKWLLEGNYLRYLPQRLKYANAVILLSASRMTCLWRAFRRFFYRRSFSDFHISIAWRLLRNIWTFNQYTMPEVVRLCRDANLPCYVVNTEKPSLC